MQSADGRMKSFASKKVKRYGTDVTDAVETNKTIRAAVSAFVVIALASFCSPSLQILNSSATDGQPHREQFNDKGKINFCVLAKTPAKVCIRKGCSQQPVQLFYSADNVSLRRTNFSPRSLCTTEIPSAITRGSLTLRERAPPV